MRSGPEITIATLSLFIFGIAYAVIVRRLRQRTHGHHGQTAWLVVVGVGVVVGVYAALTDLQSAGLLALLFAAAGLPMIAEYVDSHTDWLQRSSIVASLEELERHRDGL